MTESLSRQAFRHYKEDFLRNFPPTFNFAMISLAFLALGIYWPWTLFITFPFGVLPFFFATELSLDEAGQINYSNALYFRYYAAYYKPPFLGCYRVVVNFLRALLLGLLVSLLLALVYYFSAYAVDASFREAIDSASQYLRNSATDEAMRVLNENLSVTLFANLVSLTEGGVLWLVFVSELGVYGLNPFLRVSVNASDSKILNGVFAGGLRLGRKDFFRDYFSALWLGLVLLISGFLFGVGMGLLWTGDADRLLAMGFAGSFLFLFFYIPYYLIVISFLAAKYGDLFVRYSLKTAEQAFEEMKKRGMADAKTLDDIQKEIDATRQVLEHREHDEKPENPSKKDEDDSHSPKS